ncbi:peptidoglycan editing factor PgeF [Duncaniella freteri]|uniref:peptidoglycan editing factor PgeF n=1 Tax=Duncaniella freteri TaxID=2530391 RepID=UPI002585AFC4|nr:peptidoglycan editing factor PgeF [Duncaniella freteri]
MRLTTDSPIHELLRDGNVTAYYTSRGNYATTEEARYNGFNVCHYTGDSYEHTDICLKQLSLATGVSPEKIIFPHQVHSNDVSVITSVPWHKESLESTDAIVTNVRGIIIGVNTADCVPVAFSDSRAGIIGIAHAGWRGAANGITENTLTAMLDLGASPESIKVAMGPSICMSCFEVGTEVADRFDNTCVDRTSWDKPHVSIHRHITKLLINQGIPESNIAGFDNSLCTRCHPDTFFSARKLGVNSGRVFTFISMQ